MNESELTRNIVRELNLIRHTYAFRVHGSPYQKKGSTDITGCHQGEFFGIEMKMPGKEKNLTAIQSATITKIKKAGGRAGVATNLDEALAIIGLKRGGKN
jgi:hypothetical protein